MISEGRRQPELVRLARVVITSTLVMTHSVAGRRSSRGPGTVTLGAGELGMTHG